MLLASNQFGSAIYNRAGWSGSCRRAIFSLTICVLDQHRICHFRTITVSLDLKAKVLWTAERLLDYNCAFSGKHCLIPHIKHRFHTWMPSILKGYKDTWDTLCAGSDEDTGSDLKLQHFNGKTHYSLKCYNVKEQISVFRNGGELSEMNRNANRDFLEY